VQTDSIRILNLNIWNYNPPWTTRRERIVDLVLDTQPDAVALQEIRYRDWSIDPRHQADQILAGLEGYAAVWVPAHYWPAGSGHNVGELEWEGLAILSPHPIVDHTLLRLSRDPDDPRDSFQRLVLGAQVRTAAGPFWLFNTHFPLSAPARERVVAEAITFVRQTAGETPFLFTGDFNAEPEDPPIQFLHQQPDLQDAWITCHPEDVGYTFPAWGPEKRIDYAFVPQSVSVQDVEIVGQVENREMVSPSDHCGLLVTLKL